MLLGAIALVLGIADTAIVLLRRPESGALRQGMKQSEPMACGGKAAIP